MQLFVQNTAFKHLKQQLLKNSQIKKLSFDSCKLEIAPKVFQELNHPFQEIEFKVSSLTVKQFNVFEMLNENVSLSFNNETCFTKQMNHPCQIPHNLKQKIFSHSITKLHFSHVFLTRWNSDLFQNVNPNAKISILNR